MPESTETTFGRLFITDWRQFREIDLHFHPRLTVLTGANASGKTTLLNVLGRHFNTWMSLLGVPYRDRTGGIRWRSDSRPSDVGTRNIGFLTYRQGAELIDAQLSMPVEAQSYDLTVNGQRALPGVYITSHRSLSVYQPLQNIPIQFSTTQILFDQFVAELRNRWHGSSSPRTPLSYMKEALVAAAVHGTGNQYVEANPVADAVWAGFQEVLRRVLPESLGFESLAVRLPDLIIRTSTGDFLLEAMSGGINAIVELSWQIFLRSRDFDAFTVCIDEPENHLHPSLQRALLPGLLAAFPGISFIVATHSPFVVTAIPESNVYVLEYDDGEVTSRLLETANKAATSDVTLRRVLGLETTIPVWVEQRIAELVSSVRPDASDTDIRAVYEALLTLGMDQEFPAALGSLIRSESPGADAG